MRNTENQKLIQGEQPIMQLVDEMQLSPTTLEHLLVLNDDGVGPREFCNELTGHLCLLAYSQQNIGENGTFSNGFVRGILKLQQFLLNWEKDLLMEN